VTTCELDGAGAIKRIFNVLATRKLTAVRKIEITKVGTNPEESEA
jgi:hypothetical protein